MIPPPKRGSKRGAVRRAVDSVLRAAVPRRRGWHRRSAGSVEPSAGAGRGSVKAYFWASFLRFSSYFLRNSSETLCGTRPYFKNSMVNSALPWDNERKTVE